MEWQIIPIESICEGIYEGPHATPPDSSDGAYYLGIPALTPDGRIDFSKVPYISEKDYNKWTKRVTPKFGDIVFTNEATLNLYARIPKNFYGCLGRRLGLVRPLPNKVNTNYLFYFFFSPYWRNVIAQKKVSGSTVDRILMKKFPKFPVVLPPLPVQQKIASILSTYDTLIENNTKRICLMEQMAENLYKELFAFNRIKGKSKVVRLSEIITISRGLSYSSEEIDCVDGNDLINLKNIQGYGGFRFDGTKKYNGKYKDDQIVKEGDLIMGVTDMTQDRRTVGSVALIPNVENLSVISADLIKVNSAIDSIYLYAMFRYGNVSKYIAQFANGANVLHLKPQAVLNIKVTLPEKELIDSFVSKVKPMIQLTNSLNTEIQLLTRQRDLLLPRLMSGKLLIKA